VLEMSSIEEIKLEILDDYNRIWELAQENTTPADLMEIVTWFRLHVNIEILVG
jgi:hypothetical protein